jgi:ribosome-associated heat shock protein Hsp15
MAAEACRGGHVKIRGDIVKPSRTVHSGEVVTIRGEDLTRSVKVLGVIEKRVGPKIAPQFVEDQTPALEYLQAIEKRKNTGVGKRPKGSGRPTKKERRKLEELL